MTDNEKYLALLQEEIDILKENFIMEAA